MAATQVRGDIGAAEVFIARNVMSAAGSSSVSWSAGAYKSIRWILQVAAGGGQSSVDLTFTGSTGTLVSAIVYYPSTAGAFSTATQGAHLRIAYTGELNSFGRATIASGRIRSCEFTIMSPDTAILGAPLLGNGTGYDTDTSHDFTGCIFTFNGGSVSGLLELYGVRA